MANSAMSRRSLRTHGQSSADIIFAVNVFSITYLAEDRASGFYEKYQYTQFAQLFYERSAAAAATVGNHINTAIRFDCPIEES